MENNNLKDIKKRLERARDNTDKEEVREDINQAYYSLDLFLDENNLN